MADLEPPSFCSQCGAAASAGAAFCGACGANLLAAGTPKADPQSAPRSGAESRAAAPASPAAGGPASTQPRTPPSGGSQTLAIAVFAGVVAVGLGLVYYVSLDPPAPQRAVAGRPSAPPGGPPPGGPGALPPKHPSLELPPEVTAFLDDLSTKADAAPEDVKLWQDLARARYRAGLLNMTYRPAAKQALAHLMEIDPGNLEGLRITANIAYDEGEYAKAKEGFEAFLKEKPDDAAVLTDLGSTLLFLEDTEGATEAYNRALEADPTFLQAHFNVGIVHAQAGENEKAAAAFREARKLSTNPAQNYRIDVAIASAEGREPPPPPAALTAAGGLPADHPPVQAGGPPGDAAATAPSGPASGGGSRPVSTATTDFQKEAEAFLGGYRIVGPKIAGFEWSGEAEGKILLDAFPMDQMPPVMRNKMKSGMNEKLAELAEAHSNATPLRLELVDQASGRVMDLLDGKEWIGAFDEAQYQ